MQSQFFVRKRLWQALAVASVVSIGFFGAGAVRNHTLDFWYLPYNLALAVIPLFLAIWLQRLLKTQSWERVLPLLATTLWILFLPNSFYIVSDFIHLTETPRVDIVQDVVMLAQFSFIGLAFGFISLFIVHREFIKRLSAKWAGAVATLLLLLCSFAFYLGRDLRWNSWDIILQPTALAVDIVQHLLNPLAYPQAFIITAGFFAMLSSMYFVIWEIARAVSPKR